MGFFDFLTGGDANGQDDKDKQDNNPLMGFIKALNSDKNSQGQGGDDFFSMILKAIISYIKELISPTEKSDPPGYEDSSANTPTAPGAPPAAPTETRDQIDARNKREEADSATKYKTSIFTKYNPANITSLPHDINNLRIASENANHGQKVTSISPVADEGRIRSDFGDREAPVINASTGLKGSSEHKGLDIAPRIPGDKNVSIVAPMPGKVMFAGWKSGYGNTLDIMDIYGTTHRFGHLAEIDKSVGDTVGQGDKVAVMGMTGHATGIHLHYEQRNSDQVAFDPIIAGKTYKTNDTLPEGNTALAFSDTPSHPGASKAKADVAALGFTSTTLPPTTFVPAAGKSGQTPDKPSRGIFG